MPTYDYRCDRCGADFEFWQSMADDSLRVCPVSDGPAACVAPGEGPVRKVFSSVGISFKGAGFYKNDHGANAASRNKTDGSESSSSGSSGSDSGSTPSSDSGSTPSSDSGSTPSSDGGSSTSEKSSASDSSSSSSTD